MQAVQVHDKGQKQVGRSRCNSGWVSTWTIVSYDGGQLLQKLNSGGEIGEWVGDRKGAG